jgi:hypothetical protein
MTTIQTCKNEKEKENHRSVTDKQHIQKKSVSVCGDKNGEYLKSYFYHHGII